MNAPNPQINRARLLPGLVKRLLFVAILTVVANYFFWRHRIGINLPLYAGALCLGMITNGRGLQNIRSFWIFALLLAGSILAGAAAPSLPNFFCLATMLVLLAGICFYRTRKPWRRFFRAVLSLWGTPLRWAMVGLVAYRLSRRKSRIKPNWRIVGRTLFASFATAVPVLLVGSFLVSGNLILATWFNSILDVLFRGLENVSFLHLAFLAVFATIALGFIWPGRWRSHWPFSSPPIRPSHSDPIRIWGARVTLWLLNLLFLCANTIDALFLWLRSRPPAGVTYSDFVHHGTESLIFATISSAIVIILIVERLPSGNARDLRWAALIWIGQNIILLCGVFRRLKLYVDAYNLTILRADLALLLILVLVGFILLGVYVLKRRRFSWLCGSGSIAVFSLLYILQFCDLGGYVASYNVDRWIHPTAHTQVDLNYLGQLGPGGWGSRQRLAESDSPLSMPAQLVLTRIRSKVWQGSSKKKRWQSFQFRRYLCEAQLLHWLPREAR
jgi:Domain of unknown function (DUF4173)